MADSVAIAYLHSNDVAHSWHKSFVELVGYDLANHGRVIRGGWLSYRCGTGGIVEARNLAAKDFLDGDADWLFWVDTDMGFAPDTVDRLLEAADKTERPIVGALCFAQRELDTDGLNGFVCRARPTIMDWVEVDGVRKVVGRGHFQPNTLTRCVATGSACILIHRSALERIGEKYGTWYNRVPGSDGSPLGEDVSFCVRAGALGIPVYVHTGVRTTHLKNVWLGEAEFWAQQVVPPAVEEVAVIVPVLNRPQNAEPFMRSLRASTGMARVYVIADKVDKATSKAWFEAGAWSVMEHDTAHTFAEKVNVGVEDSDEPWLFLVGDDVTFHPGWLDHAQYAANLYDADVVGTNDLGNPRVLAGEHATHLLIRRDYITKEGASWDGPGVACHEGYRHWYVDDEIVTVAKQRGVWAMALGSIVEHLHPAWGKAETDSTYEEGQKHAEADSRLFRGRCKAYG